MVFIIILNAVEFKGTFCISVLTYESRRSANNHVEIIVRKGYEMGLVVLGKRLLSAIVLVYSLLINGVFRLSA